MARGMVNSYAMVYCVKRDDTVNVFVIYDKIWYSNIYTKKELGFNKWRNFDFLADDVLYMLGDLNVLLETLFPKYVKISEDNLGEYIDLRITLIGNLFKKYGLSPTDNAAIVEIYKNMLRILKNEDNKDDRKRIEVIEKFLIWWRNSMRLDLHVDSEIRMLTTIIRTFLDANIEK